MKMKILFVLSLVVFCSCTETRIKRYSDILEPHVGNTSKVEMDRLLGGPAYCRAEGKYQLCEYRTAIGRNEQIPYVHLKNDAMGPDLSPYEHFDVLQLYYDDFGTLRDWKPIVLPNPQQ